MEGRGLPSLPIKKDLYGLSLNGAGDEARVLLTRVERQFRILFSRNKVSSKQNCPSLRSFAQLALSLVCRPCKQLIKKSPKRTLFY